MKNKPDNNKAEQEYFTDYDTDMTLKYHGSRTANTHAAWLLPYLQPNMTLLDCGCGLGSITEGLAKAVEPGQVIGVDMSEVQIKRAQERAVEAKLSNVRYEVGDISQLGFSDNSFDALFSHDVVEHIPEPKRALREMYRVLKPGGVIGIRDVDWGGDITAPDDEIYKRSSALYETYLAGVGGEPRFGRHLGRLLNEAGFVEVKMSASYDYWGDPEGIEFVASILISALSEAGFVEWVSEHKMATVKELEAMREFCQTWPDLPGAFCGKAHCEAIGRKA